MAYTDRDTLIRTGHAGKLHYLLRPSVQRWKTLRAANLVWTSVQQRKQESYFGRYGVCKNRSRLDGKPNNWKRKMPQVYKMAHTEDTEVEMQITWQVLRALNCAIYHVMIGVGWSLFFLNFA